MDFYTGAGMPTKISRPSASGNRAGGTQRKSGLIVLACMLPVVVWFYWWTATSSLTLYAGEFYNRLTDAFLSGQLHLLDKPRPELLALSNPRDPTRNEPYRLHDAVLFRDRYYVYHGPAPALTLFLPFRVLTGKHLPENLGAVVFAGAGFIFAALIWLELCNLFSLYLPVAWLAAGVWTLAFCQSVPFILRRAVFYETAIAAGYCFLMAAFFVLLRALSSRALGLFAIAGLLFGLACGARPHMVFPAAIAFLLVLVYPGIPHTRKLQQVLSFTAPLATCCALLGLYNYARFGNPVEFGVAYILAGAVHTQGVHLSLGNVVPGLYYMLLHPPLFRSEFPFAYIGGRPWLNVSLPANYFQEGVAGMVALFPPAVLAFIAPLLVKGARRAILLAMLLAASSVILFIALTGWSTQRYEVDFAPLLLIVTLTALAILWQSTRGNKRVFLTIVLFASIAYSTIANAGLSVTGQTDTLKRGNPEAYARIYTFFHHEPGLIMNPGFDGEAELVFPQQPAGTRQPLVTAGRGPLAHVLYAEYTGPNTMRIVSREVSHPGGESSSDLPYIPNRPYRFNVEYNPSANLLTVVRDGQLIFTHGFVLLPATPNSVAIGRNDVARDLTPARFSGDVRVRSLHVY